MGLRDHFHFLVIPHSGAFQVGPEVAVYQPHRGEVLNAGKPHVLELAQEQRHVPERVRAADAGQHGRVPHHGKHFGSHFDHDGVGVPIRHQARQRTPAGHAVAPGVVDDDQIGAAGLRKLCRDSRSGAAADNRPAGADLPLQPCDNFFSRNRHMQSSFAAAYRNRSTISASGLLRTPLTSSKIMVGLVAAPYCGQSGNPGAFGSPPAANCDQ